MGKPLEFWLEDSVFWLTVAFDFLLVLSIIFALVYTAALALASLMPGRRSPAPGAWSLPLMLALALALAFLPPGQLIAQSLARQIIPLMIKADQFWLPQALAGIWLAGVVLHLARLAARCLGLRRALAGYRPAADDPALAEAIEAASFRRPVALKTAGADSPAASWGLFRAVIVIPDGLAERFDRRERLGLYLHELAHIANRDSLKYLALSILGALMWFNPLVGRAIERYKCHLEIACDRQVAGRGLISPLEYARLITKAASRPGSLLSGFSGDYQSVIRRFSYIFNDRTLRPVKRDRLWGGAGLAAAGLLALGLVLTPFEAESRAALEEMIAANPAPPGAGRVIFFWQGALGSYSQVQVDK